MSRRYIFLAGIGLSLLSFALSAYDLDDKLSIGGTAALGGQCQELNEGVDTCRGALPFQPHMSYEPTDRDEFYVKLGFAAGNGLNNVSTFQLSPWVADFEDDLKNINGRGRNYLLTAWYRHEFQFAAHNTLRMTLGMIDATDYLDIENTLVTEVYYRFVANRWFALTTDFQYMRDNKRSGKNIEGFIFGLRGDAPF